MPTDTPAIQVAELQRAIYRLPGAQFRRTRDELIELMQVGEPVTKPVRNLVALTEPADLSAYGEVISADNGRVTLRVPRAEAARITARILAGQPARDLTIEEPPIDDVIERVFAA